MSELNPAFDFGEEFMTPIVEGDLPTKNRNDTGEVSVPFGSQQVIKPLEVWQARRVAEVLKSGFQKPLVIRCVSTDPLDPKLRKDFVVKCIGLPNTDNFAIFRELFGTLVARSLRINTFAPAIVELGDDFVQSANISKLLIEEGIHLQSGVAFGCEYSPMLAPLTPTIPNGFLTPDQQDQATRLYAFDMLARNGDRQFAAMTPQNCCLAGNKITSYDFEKAFQFLFQTPDEMNAWHVDPRLASRHLFYPFLRALRSHGSVVSNRSGGRILDFLPLLRDLESISEGTISQLCGIMPSHWQGLAAEVMAHISIVRDNSDRFHLELLRGLT